MKLTSPAAALAVGGLAILSGGKRVQGHGSMTYPKPRQPESLYWYQVGCMIGCRCSGSGKETYPTPESVDCTDPAEPAVSDSVRTWNADEGSPRGDWNRFMPWRRPGSSLPIDSCGIASGFLPEAKVQYPHMFDDERVVQGMKGTDLPRGDIVVWEAGSVVEASYNLTVNHGGGYQYRVCPVDDDSPPPDEACFEANPLKFATNEHIVVYGSRNITIPAVDTSEEVQPAGSAWRRLPFPACNCDLGASCSIDSQDEGTRSYENGVGHGTCSTGLQFEAVHITDGIWPEGHGYYLATLGSVGYSANKQKSPCHQHKNATICAIATADGCKWKEEMNVCYETSDKQEGLKCEGRNGDESACLKTNGCEWYGEKDVCFETKDTLEVFKCENHNGDESVCLTKTGCKWYGKEKNVCYASDEIQDDKSLSPTPWNIVDKLVAPSRPGEYILQWRWDNEQTPQIWTTCADVSVRSSVRSADTNDPADTNGPEDVKSLAMPFGLATFSTEIGAVAVAVAAMLF